MIAAGVDHQKIHLAAICDPKDGGTQA